MGFVVFPPCPSQSPISVKDYSKEICYLLRSVDKQNDSIADLVKEIPVLSQCSIIYLVLTLY